MDLQNATVQLHDCEKRYRELIELYDTKIITTDELISTIQDLEQAAFDMGYECCQEDSTLKKT